MENLEIIKEHRRHLHSYPELSLKEFKTADYIRNVLFSLKLKDIEVVNTSTICFINRGKGKAILFRADIDALSLAEKNNISYRSKNKNIMHACGHDGHTALLLVFAKYLAENLDKIDREVVLVFQAGEEGFGGAKAVLDSGKIKNIDKCFAVHVDPSLPSGTIEVTDGLASVGSVEFNVIISGVSCHLACRENGVDALKTGLLIGNALNHLEDEWSYAKTILHIGAINGGSQRNVVCDKLVLECSFRYFDKRDRDRAIHRIHETVFNISAMTKAKSQVQIFQELIPVSNDRLCNDIIRNLAKTTEGKPRQTSEDFSYFLEKFKGALVWVGVKDEKKERFLHSSEFDFDEVGLLPALEMYIKLLSY